MTRTSAPPPRGLRHLSAPERRHPKLAQVPRRALVKVSYGATSSGTSMPADSLEQPLLGERLFCSVCRATDTGIDRQLSADNPAVARRHARLKPLSGTLLHTNDGDFVSHMEPRVPSREPYSPAFPPRRCYCHQPRKSGAGRPCRNISFFNPVSNG